MITRWFENWSERSKLAVLVFVLSLVGVALSLWLGGFWATVVVTLPGLTAILNAIGPAFTSPGSGGARSKAALASLGIAALAVFTANKWRAPVNELATELLSDVPEPIRKVLLESSPDTPSVVGLAFLAVVIVSVNYFLRDTTALQIHPTPIDKDFPERTFPESLGRYARWLVRDLDKLDLETNWTDEDFVPLEAEVEIRAARRHRRITDLLTVLRRDRRSKIFLVLGDPGSGKSVALRTLCRNLLREVGKTKRLPVYVNLREWEPRRSWMLESPPTGQELYEFVLSNLKSRADVFGAEFLEKYFKKMLDRGRLLVILDSFDEIPLVLDVDEDSWLIGALSNALDEFLTGSHDSRGVVASRLYRKPNDKLGATKVLEIRPFSEQKVADALQRSLLDRKLVRSIFHERRELLSLARNPFTASLITSYAREHGNELPSGQAELYSSYVERRLRNCRERMEQRHIEPDAVQAGAIAISDVMFATERFGLEAPVDELAKLPFAQNVPVEDVVDILVFAHLGRLGSGVTRRFSFVHRRFNEYFLVQSLKRHPDRVPKDAIPTDSRFRDALVLFCEVADRRDATDIAHFTWRNVQGIDLPEIARSSGRYFAEVHSLRFLADAFRRRPECLEDFSGELANHVDRVIQGSGGLVVKKVAVEAVGLLPQGRMSQSLVLASRLENSWIDETAFRSCQYMAAATDELKVELRRMLLRIPTLAFLRRSRELMFSLSLTDAFKPVRLFCVARLGAIAAKVLSAFVLLLAAPLMTVVVGMPYLLITLKMRMGGRRSDQQFVFGPAMAMAMFGTLAFGMYPAVFSGWAPVTRFSTRAVMGGVLPEHAAAVAALAALAVIAIADLIFVRRRWQVVFVCAATVAMPLVVVVVGGVIEFVVRSTVALWLGGLLYVGFIGTVAVTGLRSLWTHVCDRWRDRRTLIDIGKIPGEMSRERIASIWRPLRTRKGRQSFVHALREARTSATGEWPSGQIPNVANDEASTVLAQLEEDWLRLGR